MISSEERAIGAAIIKLMKGVVYRETHEDDWRTLERERAAVDDHFARIGVAVVVDETEGYAFLKTVEPEDGEDPLPRFVQRRALTYNLSLLLLLLRKRLAEFEASGDEGKLVMQREQIVEMLRVYLPETTNEVRVVTQVDQTIAQAAKLGFVHDLTPKTGDGAKAWEVRRILKAYVDAEVMGDFESRLVEYAASLTKGDSDE